jgi:hypothetical protein
MPLIKTNVNFVQDLNFLKTYNSIKKSFSRVIMSFDKMNTAMAIFKNRQKVLDMGVSKYVYEKRDSGDN